MSAKEFEIYSFIFDDNGRWWVCVVSMGYKTLGPFTTWKAAQDAAMAYQ